jgi:hypothetical protein
LRPFVTLGQESFLTVGEPKSGPLSLGRESRLGFLAVVRDQRALEFRFPVFAARGRSAFSASGIVDCVVTVVIGHGVTSSSKF